jgi:hypothetical protein
MSLWMILSVGLVFFSALIIKKRFLPPYDGLKVTQLAIVLFSFFPFFEGIQAGQNHVLTLSLVLLALDLNLSGRNFLAGLAAGLLVYKPQLLFGLILVWVVWRNLPALSGMALIGLLWPGMDVLLHGLAPYAAYLQVSPQLLQLPYVEGFPGYLMVTPYGLLATAFPSLHWETIYRGTQIISVLLGAGLFYLAWRYRQADKAFKSLVLAFSIVFPLISMPYTLFHDLLLIIPILALVSRYNWDSGLLYVSVAVYTGSFFLLLISNALRIALGALVPLAIVGYLVYLLRKRRKSLLAHSLGSVSSV